MGANMTEAFQFEGSNAMPAGTWHFLKMNDTAIEIPEGLAIAPQVECRMDEKHRSDADFMEVLGAFEQGWLVEFPAPTPEEIAAQEAARASEADATYGGTAQSAYQMQAEALEQAHSLTVSFENGVGDETAAYLRYVAGEPIVVKAEQRENASVHVHVAGAPGTISIAAIDVIAGAGASVTLAVTVDSPVDAGPCAIPGIAGTTVRVFADAEAEVRIGRTQALGPGVIDIDDMGLFVGENSAVSIYQGVLGGSASFTGLAGDLRGRKSSVDVETRYLGFGAQKRDFNYVLRHHGQKSKCNLQATGVLAGTSQKTLRGTIDLIRGAKGAEGQENESVLLVDEGVRNKTVPVILCNEDDVAGNHGATIGHVRPEQMYYLASRGLSQEAAERMFVGAAMEQAYYSATDGFARQAVLNLGEHEAPGFASLFDEED